MSCACQWGAEVLVYNLHSFCAFFLVVANGGHSTPLCNLTIINAGMTGLVSLNISNSRITNSGLQHLRPLHNLTSLALQACKVTLPAIEKLQASSLPNLTVIRVQ